MFPPQELAVQRRQLVGSGHHLAELFVVGAVRALRVAVQFRRSRGQYEQSHLSLLTSFLELRSELRPTVHLYDWRYDIKN